MTPEERARALHAQWQNRTLWKEEMILDIEKVIKAAIKEEREACAVIGDEEAGHHAGEMERLKRNDLAVTIEEKAMNIAKGIARRIRARSS